MRNGLLATLVAVCCVGMPGISQEKQVTLVPVTYDGLKREVVKQRGKVLVVDFWGGTCRPCRKEFPRFLEMHRKYADQGLVVITVCTDTPPGHEPKVAAAIQFLRDSKSPFLNLLLTEPWDSWSAKVDLEGVPCYFLFDRQGRWVRYGGRVEGEVNYADLEQTVMKMLNEK